MADTVGQNGLSLPVGVNSPRFARSRFKPALLIPHFEANRMVDYNLSVLVRDSFLSRKYRGFRVNELGLGAGLGAARGEKMARDFL
jgi:hypothetical protein